MPLYIYRNPKTDEIKEVVQGMNDKHEYSEAGIQWVREFTNPQAAVDTQVSLYSPKDFVEKSRNKKGSVGNLWDQAKELSIKREEKEGKCSFKQKYYEDYSKKRRGKKHPLASEEGY